EPRRAVGLAGRRVYQARHSGAPAGVGDVERALHVCLDVALGRDVAVRNTDERGEMEYDVATVDRLAHSTGVSYVARHDLDRRAHLGLIQPTGATERRVVTEDAHPRTGGNQRFNQVRSDEAFAAGHEHRHAGPVGHACTPVANSTRTCWNSS